MTALMRRGRERYDIFCSPCHGLTGEGDGMVVQRGYRRPPSFHVDRLRQAPPGHMYDVITNGFGAMPDYAAQIPVRDRWAIAAYMRALQLSQNANVAAAVARRAGAVEMNVQTERHRRGAAFPSSRQLQSKLLIAGGIGAAVCAIGFVMNPAQFVRSFLPAYMWLLSITLGSLGARDGAPGVRRRLGRGHSTHSRRGDPHAAVADDSLHSDRARPAFALSVG